MYIKLCKCVFVCVRVCVVMCVYLHLPGYTSLIIILIKRLHQRPSKGGFT